MFCDKYNCLFIHIPKCAGSSIETVLLGEPYDDPMNPSIAKKDKHWSCEQAYVSDRKRYRKSFIFTVIRDPWSRILSQWIYKRNLDSNHPRSLKDEILHPWTRKTTCYPMLHICGVLQPKLIIRMETLHEDYQKLKRILGLTKDLPHMMKIPHKPFYEYYTPELVNLVSQIYKDDINSFGFDYNRAVETAAEVK